MKGARLWSMFSAKSANKRRAVASGKLFCNQEAFSHAKQGTAKKRQCGASG